MRGLSVGEACGVNARIRLLVAAVGLAVAWPVRGEFPQPRLAAIHPPGGQRGTTVEVRLVGADLDALERLSFSHPGIVAEPVMTQPTEFDPEPKPVAGRMRVRISEQVPPGAYDAVAVGRYGVSNPRIFMVGAAPEVVKPRSVGAPETAFDVPTDVTVCGLAEPGVADHYAISLLAGQRIRIEPWARRIESRLTPSLAVLDPEGRVVAKATRRQGEDPWLEFVAVKPGRHVVRIHDTFMGGGDEMPYRLSLSTGPVVEAVFPPAAPLSGTVRLTAIGRGLPDAAPATIEGGAEGLGQVSIDARLGSVEAGASGRITWRMLSPRDTDAPLVDAVGGVLDTMPIPAAILASKRPVTVEQEPNDEAAKPQRIEVPAAVAGRFHPIGDRDWFAFDARAGETLVLELYSNRLGLPTDASLLVQRLVTGGDGAVSAEDVAFADDGPVDFPDPLANQPALDPAVSFKVPADGTYRVLVRELAADSTSGVDKAWVLDLRRPEPGFHLVAMLAERDRADQNKFVRTIPSLAAGGSLALDVLAIRRDGFTGEIEIEAEGLPPGVTAHPSLIRAGANRGSIVLTAAEGMKPSAGSFRVLGHGTLEGGEISGVASVATLRWNVDNQTMPMIFRESREIPVSVTADTAPLAVQAAETRVWEVVRGGSVNVPLAVTRRAGAKGAVSLAWPGLPAELKIGGAMIDEKATTVTVSITADTKLLAGTYPLVFEAVSKMAYARNLEAAKAARADAERLAAIAKDRTAKVEAAKQAVAAAQKAVADARAAVQPAPESGPAPPDIAALEQAVATATASQRMAEAALVAAEAERTKRDAAAKAAEAASATQDIDVPLAVPPIMLVVKDPPAEAPKP